MTETPPLLQMILENIQHDLADLRDEVRGLKGDVAALGGRFDAFQAAMDARWRENQTEHREFRDALTLINDRLSREQTLRERNARHTIAVLDALVNKVQSIDARTTAVEDGQL